MRNPPSNSEDVLDSRDILARIEELEGQEKIDENEADELTVLTRLAEEASGSPDWTDGETLIRDSYFEDYARELAEDTGAMPDSSSWPARCIDWKQAAEELQNDYFSVDFDGVEYWIRS